MTTAKRGDKVRIHYNGTLEDGNIFDSTEGKKTFEFTIGEGRVLPKFEKMVEGMEVGEKKSFHLEPDEAYGNPREELVVEVLRQNLPKDLVAEVGQQIQIRQKKTGVVTQAEIVRVSEHSVTLNANHPLAGKRLKFDIELVEIV
jgi:FKBP-type peptidyl-prolyl cis-trans isomerase 2